MTRRDYEAVAEALFAARMDVPFMQYTEPTHPDYASAYDAINLVIDKVADVMAADNRGFNRQLFVTACVTGRAR